MGSIFNVPLVRLTLEECLPWVARWAGDIVGTQLDATEDFRARGLSCARRFCSWAARGRACLPS